MLRKTVVANKSARLPGRAAKARLIFLEEGWNGALGERCLEPGMEAKAGSGAGLHRIGHLDPAEDSPASETAGNDRRSSEDQNRDQGEPRRKQACQHKLDEQHARAHGDFLNESDRFG